MRLGGAAVNGRADRSRCLHWGAKTMGGFSWWSDFHCPPPRSCAWAGRVSTCLAGYTCNAGRASARRGSRWGARPSSEQAASPLAHLRDRPAAVGPCAGRRACRRGRRGCARGRGGAGGEPTSPRLYLNRRSRGAEGSGIAPERVHGPSRLDILHLAADNESPRMAGQRYEGGP